MVLKMETSLAEVAQGQKRDMDGPEKGGGREMDLSRFQRPKSLPRANKIKYRWSSSSSSSPSPFSPSLKLSQLGTEESL